MSSMKDRQFMWIFGPGAGTLGDNEYETLRASGREIAAMIEDNELSPDDWDRKGIEGLHEAQCHLMEHPLAPYGAYSVLVRLLDAPDPKDWSPPQPE